MTHKFKPGDMVVISARLSPTVRGYQLDARNLWGVPIAIRTDQGFIAVVDSPLYRGILSGRSLYVRLPEHGTYGLVLAYEHDDYVPVDGDEPVIREHRIFIMISTNGEPEYVRVWEHDLVKLSEPLEQQI